MYLISYFFKNFKRMRYSSKNEVYFSYHMLKNWFVES